MATKARSTWRALTASTTLPAELNGTSSTGRPRRRAASRARSTDTPRGWPSAPRLARIGLPKLIAARSLPVEPSSATAAAGRAGVRLGQPAQAASRAAAARHRMRRVGLRTSFHLDLGALDELDPELLSSLRNAPNCSGEGDSDTSVPSRASDGLHRGLLHGRSSWPRRPSSRPPAACRSARRSRTRTPGCSPAGRPRCMPGRSGTSGERSRVLTASAFSRPALTCGSTDGDVPKVTWVSPAITDWTAGRAAAIGNVRSSARR